MDSTKFPINSGEMASLTFIQAFEQKPKIVEFVRKLWVESACSGIYLDFFQYCRGMLKNPMVCAEHEQRCFKYVKDHPTSIPIYLQDYVKKEDEHRNDEI